MTALVPPKSRRDVRPSSGQSVVINADWPLYERLLDAFAEEPGVRLTYDRGRLEIMAPLFEHDGDTYNIGQLIDIWCDVRNVDYRAGRSTTFRREDVASGVEPNNSYWITNAAAMRGVRTLDLTIHPTPDLFIEIDVTNRALPRLPIFAALGIAEVWRVFGDRIGCVVLRDGVYVEVSESEQLPGLKPADLLPFLRLAEAENNLTAGRRFRAWALAQP